MEPLLVTRELTKSYAEGLVPVHAVRCVSLTVRRQEFLAIMGRSGAGKSTLLQLLGGITRPSGGSVVLDGVELCDLDDDALAALRRERIGLVFQAFNLLPILAVVDNVALPAGLAGRSRRAARDDARRALAAVGIEHLADRSPSELSGGEQQRVAIARALCMRPPLLLVDEPTGNLDTAAGWDVMRVLKQLNDGGQSIVLVTHDPKIAGVASTQLTMEDGVLRPADDAARARGAEAVERIFRIEP